MRSNLLGMLFLGSSGFGCHGGPVNQIQNPPNPRSNLAGDNKDAGPIGQDVPASANDDASSDAGKIPVGQDATAGVDAEAQADATMSMDAEADAAVGADAQTDANISFPDAGFPDAGDAFISTPDATVPPQNHPPVIGHLLSPPNGAKWVVVDNQGHYPFLAEVSDSDGDTVTCDVILLTKSGTPVTSQRVEVAPGEHISAILNTPDLAHLCWQVSCVDSHQARSDDSPQACFYTTAPGVVQWWPMDELDNGVMEDKSGAGQDGVLHGPEGSLPALVPGALSSALSCDGADDSLQTPSERLLGFANSWSVSFWLFVEAPDHNETVLTLGKKSPNPDINAKNFTEIRNLGNGLFSIQYLSDDHGGLGGAYTAINTTNPVATEGAWHHIAITKTNQNDLDAFHFYLDGVSQPLAGGGNLFPQVDDFDRLITLCAEIDGSFFTGMIDELILRNDVMSENEVLAECNNNDLGIHCPE